MREERTHPVRAVGQTGRCGACLWWLDLACVHFDADSPGDAKEDREEIDHHNYDPAASTVAPMDAMGGVQGSYKDHTGRQA